MSPIFLLMQFLLWILKIFLSMKFFVVVVIVVDVVMDIALVVVNHLNLLCFLTNLLRFVFFCHFLSLIHLLTDADLSFLCGLFTWLWSLSMGWR